MAEKKLTKSTLKNKGVQFLGTGRRKKAIARVRLLPNGTGKITINKVDIDKINDQQHAAVMKKSN